MPLFGNRVFANVLKVRIKMRSCLIRVKVSYKRQKKIHRDINSENGGRDRGDAATSLGIPETTRNWKSQGRFSPRAFRGSVALPDNLINFIKPQSSW